MIEFENNLYVGVGNEPAGSNGAFVAHVTPDDEIVVEMQLDEQGVIDMHAHDGKLYVCGCDPTDDWTFGNLYIRAVDGAWSKRRTLPLTIHCWGACHDSAGDLWVACGCHAGDNATWEGRVMRSTDDGVTWAENTQLNNYRMFDVIEHQTVMYAVGYNAFLLSELWRKSGGGWEYVDTIKPYRYPRLISFGTKLLSWVNNLSAYFVDCVTGVQYGSPFSRLMYPCNCLVVVDEYLYALANDGYIWRTTNLATWQRYSYVANAISIGYWPSQNCLVVSDKGAQAKLWRIPI